MGRIILKLKKKNLTKNSPVGVEKLKKQFIMKITVKNTVLSVHLK